MLGKDEPHPVALRPTAAQLVEDTRIERRLSVEEALEVEGIGHGAEFAPRSTSRSRSNRWLSRIFSRAPTSIMPSPISMRCTASALLGQNFRDRHQAFRLANLYDVITPFR